MSLLPWRKLQAGLSGNGDSYALQTASKHIASGTGGGRAEGSFDSLTVNNLVVRKTNKIPVGTDKYI